MRRPRWRLSGDAFELVLVPFGGDRREPGVALGAIEGTRAFDAMRDIGTARARTSEELSACARYLAAHHPRVAAFARTDTRALVREAIARGVLCAWRLERHLPARVEGAADHPGAEASEFAGGDVQRTWIEIELTDMDGAPMPGERYWIKLPDGTIHEGSLDAQGRAYFGDLDPGSAEIRWPDRDGDAVTAAPPQGQRSVGTSTSPDAAGTEARRERTWVAIALTDMDDVPIPHERYWIKLPDGTVREGVLDAQGSAWFDDLDPGQCVIRWPDRDEESTVAARDVAASPESRADVDADAQSAALVRAATVGSPTCEVCARPAANG